MSYKLNEWPNQKDDQDKATQATGMDTIQEDDSQPSLQLVTKTPW